MSVSTSSVSASKENRSVACVAFNEKKVLIAHRKSGGQMGGRWEFPGGKAEEGETDEQSIIREMREEFGIEVSVGEKIAQASFNHNGNTFSLSAYLINVPHNGLKEKYVLSEHSEYRWAEPAEIPLLNFVDSDMLLYPQILKYLAESLPDVQALK